MKKKFIFLSTLFFCVSSNAVSSEISKDISCFSSNNGKINFRLVILTNKEWIGGYIKYQHSDKSITVSPLKSEEDSRDGRPSIFTETWAEILNGKVTGKYSWTYQGAIFENLVYTGSNNKSIHFNQNINVYDPNKEECNWN